MDELTEETKVVDENKETCSQEHANEETEQACCQEAGTEANDQGCDADSCQCDQPVDSEINKLKEQVEQLQDQLLRQAAEVENFKRRMNEERVRESKYRAQSVITKIIPAIDNFERALAATVEEESTTTFLTGFKMIHNQLVEALAQEGVEIIESEGIPFDPTVHQAVMQEAVSDVESGIVLAELQRGYKLKDRVIRPAMVKVSE